MRILIIILASLHVLAAGAYADTTGEVAIGTKLPEAKIFSMRGPPRMLSTLFGKPLIINVWASWCGPCRAEMASLERLSRIDTKRQFVVIGVSTDDDAIAASEYVRKAGLSFENFVDDNLVLETMLGARTIPLTLIIDSQGRVLARIRGSQDWAGPNAIALVEKHLKIRISR